MTRPVLLDLYCGAGGAAVGYHRAGFDIVGVDNRPQPDYPYPFIQADALTPPFHLGRFDAIHASPPCQRYSTITPDGAAHPDLYADTRAMLETAAVPWVIENVRGAPYRSGLLLCGSMFGMRVRRHRMFESNVLLMAPCSCDHETQGKPLGVWGDGGPSTGRHNKAHKREWPALMAMPWSDWRGCREAVPPAYTEWVGHQLLAAL